MNSYIPAIWKTLGSIDNQLATINDQITNLNTLQYNTVAVPVFFMQDDVYNSSNKLGTQIVLFTFSILTIGPMIILAFRTSNAAIDLSSLEDEHNVTLRIPLHGILSESNDYVSSIAPVGISFYNNYINEGAVTNTIGSAEFISANSDNGLIISGSVPTHSIEITCNNQNFPVGDSSENLSHITIFGFQYMIFQNTN